MLDTDDLNQCITFAAKATARSLDEATLKYWHVHTPNVDRDQPNEQNLTSHFLMHLFSTLKQVDRAPSMYFEANIQGDILDGLLVLNGPDVCILVESKHLNSQNKDWNIATDVLKMQRVQKELQNRLPSHGFIHLVLSDNWFDQFDKKWEQEAAILNWNKSTFEIRKTPAGDWRLLLAYCHVPREL